VAKLNRQQQRLYGHPQASSSRCLCLIFTRASDWPALSELQQAIQHELDLPAPALSVDGQGFRLWLSLAEAVDVSTGSAFLEALRQRYLADLPASRLQLDPNVPATLPPLALAADERWSAFIDPTMGSMFCDEPWLDLPPNQDQQADLLSRFTSLSTTDFANAHALLLAQNTPSTANDAPQPAISTVNPPEMFKTCGPFADPHSFLLAVINDPGISLAQRIDAAKALLPYASR